MSRKTEEVNITVHLPGTVGALSKRAEEAVGVALDKQVFRLVEERLEKLFRGKAGRAELERITMEAFKKATPALINKLADDMRVYTS